MTICVKCYEKGNMVGKDNCKHMNWQSMEEKWLWRLIFGMIGGSILAFGVATVWILLTW